MNFSVQIPQRYVRLGDFTGLTRYGYPFGGPSPDELSLETLETVNSRWEAFYTIAYSSLKYFARNDEDLVQHGMLAVRGKLCQNPDAPISHLMTCAKGEILTAISGIGSSVDTHALKRQHPYQQEEGRVNPKTGDWQDVFEYAVATSLDSVEQRALLNRFYDSLTELAFQFVRLSLVSSTVELLVHHAPLFCFLTSPLRRNLPCWLLLYGLCISLPPFNLPTHFFGGT